MKFETFLELELTKAQELYSKVILSLDEIENFVSEEKLNRRKYVKYMDNLKKYIDIIEKVIENNHNKEFLDSNSKNQWEIEINNYKKNNKIFIDQIKTCTDCKCFNCNKNCEMEGCNRCEQSGRIAFCDNEKKSVYLFQNKTLQLLNNKTHQKDVYTVLAIIEDVEYKQLFMIIQLKEQKYVLYYYPEITGIKFGEITDADDLNFAVECYENVCYICKEESSSEQG